MTLPINRIAIYVGLLLLAVCAVASVFAHSSSCDECCATGECTDCQDCQCAYAPGFVMPASADCEFYLQRVGGAISSIDFLPDRDFWSDLDRPPRALYS